jgi:uncharacterized membrane protein
MESEQNNSQAQQTQTTTPAAPAPAATGAANNANSNRMLMGILAYFGILVIIPYLTAKDDPFVKFHVKQGIVLAAIWVAFWVAGMMVWALYPIISIANLALLVLSILGIINVVQNKEAELPVVGSLAKHVNI